MNRMMHIIAATLCVAITLTIVSMSARADVIDLGGETIGLTDLANATYNDIAFVGNEVTNGTLNVTGDQVFADGVFTFGTGLTLNQTSGQWGFSGRRTVKFVDGGMLNYASTSTMYIGRTTAEVTYNNSSQLILDSGIVESKGGIYFSPYASKSGYNKNVVLNFTMDNNSSLTVANNMYVKFGPVERTGSYKHTTEKVTVAVTNSSISAGRIHFGSNNNYLSNNGSSYIDATFGPGSDITCMQFYVYLYPTSTIKFDGATVHAVAGDVNKFGKNSSVTTFAGYQLLSGGLTFDLSYDMTHGSLYAPLIGTGGFTKTGSGTFIHEYDAFQFTGPLTVSNGTLVSSQYMAASAFNVDGSSSVLQLSGSLTNATVSLSATAGGTLTLSGATLSDTSPSLTLSGGGTTDYFTRDAAVASYTLDSLTLGPGAVLDIDADATSMDLINATTTNITATAESPLTINLTFSAAPSTGQTFTFFEVDSADQVAIVAKVGDVSVLHETSIVDGRLVMTVVADDYTWNGTQTNWGDTGAWTKSGATATWSDGNNAIFSTANAKATLAADVAASKVSFTADATISGTAALTASEVSVDSDVLATISAATSNALIKTGTGTLTLGASRTEQTTLTEGTLAMASGATVNPAYLTLGTDVTKPVVFDYGGQTLTSDPAAYLGVGMDVTLTNGVYTYSSQVVLGEDAIPSELTIAKGATLQSGDKFKLNTTSSAVVNIAGGTLKSTIVDNNWIMQASYYGQLYLNITDGGLAEFGGDTYMLPCRDGSDEYQSPELHVMVADSTVRVSNSKSLRLGYDSNTKTSATPVFTLAATNSVFDIGSGIYIGNNKTGLPTDGSYTVDFENCVITGRYLSVFSDRTLNNALFSGSTIVFNNAGSITAPDGDSKWFTVGANGLTLDTNGKNISLNANLGGSGAVTKIGSGTLTVAANQTLTSALNVNAGTVAIPAGVSVARATTVANGAILNVDGTEQATVSTLSLESGSTLNIGTYTAGVVSLAVTTLTLPESGTATLTVNGGAFTVGTYKILECSGIAASDVQDKLVPSTGDEPYSYSVSGSTLILTIGTPVHGRWRASAGSGDFSEPCNWEDCQVPVAGDALDFSTVTSATTINCGDLSETEFGAVTMGTGVITFRGSLTATSFSDTSKIWVAADSTVTLDGDLAFSSDSGEKFYITYKVDEGGAFVVTGTITGNGTADVGPYSQASSGYIVAKGLVNKDGMWYFRLNSSRQAQWVIGEDGISGPNGFWLWNSNTSAAILKSDADYSIDAAISAGTNKGKGLTFDTSGWSDTTASYTVTADSTFVGVKPIVIKGGGKFLCNYTPQRTGDQSAYSGPITVTDTATLAINAGKYPTTGAITVNSGATLQVAESAKENEAAAVTLGGSLTLKNGACLGFNYTEFNDPILDLTNKNVAFEAGETTNVVVKISAADGFRARGGERVLTSGGKFAGATVSLASGAPDRVNGVFVNEDGNIVLDVKKIPFAIIVR